MVQLRKKIINKMLNVLCSNFSHFGYKHPQVRLPALWGLGAYAEENRTDGPLVKQ